jgi:hypothetical protein
MQQIAEWLKQLGISECSQRLFEHDVGILVLRHLTGQDSNELGFSLGHRT